MRRFSSYGPINTRLHYYAPREELIAKAYTLLTGENQNENESGHYITTWAPRQCGKTWVMQQVVRRIKQSGSFHCGIFTIERGKKVKTEESILEVFTEKLTEVFGISFPRIKQFKQIPGLFTKTYFKDPVILVIDEFDALKEEFISDFATVFRDMFVSRTNEETCSSQEKTYLLHGLALVGVRSVLGIENTTGSPFNVQKSLHVPNLNQDEVKGMFQWYEKESGQAVAPEVSNRLFEETNGQPGLISWFGELLTDTYNKEPDQPITQDHFEDILPAAIKVLPNNNILNIISKVREEEYTSTVLELFKTDQKVEFTYDNIKLNYLYLNGVIDYVRESRDRYVVKFSSPFVQKRLFNSFSNTLFSQMGRLVDPFLNLDQVVTSTHLDIPQMISLYQAYLENNREWLFKDAPRRSDLRLYEAIYHFHLYAWLNEFLRSKSGSVFPEFPTGNGKIDLLISYKDKTYGIELKSFTDHSGYKNALMQAAHYGRQLGLNQIFLVFFLENIDQKNRETYEVPFQDPLHHIEVIPIFVQTGKV
jgi:hypothetical protein